MEITFDTAKLAKEKGFEQIYVNGYPSIGFGYTEDGVITFISDKSLIYLSPEQYVLQEWLRNNHCLHINIKHKPFSQHFGFTITGGYQKGEQGLLYSEIFSSFEKYELALEKALKEALDFI